MRSRLRRRMSCPPDACSRAGCCWMSGQLRWPAGSTRRSWPRPAGDPGTWVLTLPAEHPLLGRTFCRAPGCQTTCAAATRVCLDCQRRLAAAGLGLQDVALLPPPQGKRWLGTGDGTCRVTECPRPWVTSGQPLCPEHLSQRDRLGVSIADFTARPDAIALPSHGTCAVASCPRQWSAPASLEAPMLADLPTEYQMQALCSTLPRTFSEAYHQHTSAAFPHCTSTPSQP